MSLQDLKRLELSSTPQSVDISSCRGPKCSVNIISLTFLSLASAIALFEAITISQLGKYNRLLSDFSHSVFIPTSTHFFFITVCILKHTICYHVAILFKSL